MTARWVGVILCSYVILIDRGAALHINKMIVKGYSLQVLEYVLGHVKIQQPALAKRWPALLKNWPALAKSWPALAKSWPANRQS